MGGIYIIGGFAGSFSGIGANLLLAVFKFWEWSWARTIGFFCL